MEQQEKKKTLLLWSLLAVMLVFCMLVSAMSRRGEGQTVPDAPRESGMESGGGEDDPALPENYDQIDESTLLDGLSLNGTQLPRCADGMFYLCVDGDAASLLREGVWSVESGASLTLDKRVSRADTDFDVLIAKNRPILIDAVIGEKHLQGRIVLTTLPVMVVTPEEGLTADDIVHGDDGEDLPCRITLLDASAFRGGAPQLLEQNAGIHIRGGTARYYPKKSYKFSLKNSWGDSYKTSLAGMRTDNDWILLAGYTDGSKVREKLAAELWAEIISDRAYSGASTHLEYVELVMDGAYAGLYLLQEPIDAKTAGAQEGNYLYKSLNWDYPDRESGSWGGFELKYPKKADEQQSADAFDVLCRYAEWVQNSSDREFLETMEAMLDVEEWIDHYLFISLIYGYDNLMNNNYYLAQPDADGLHIRIIPWDFDCTFGYSNWLYVNDDGTTEQHYLDRMPVDGMEDTLAIERMYSANRSAFLLRAGTRWRSLRERFLNEEYLEKKLRGLFGTLEASGAYRRDETLWNDYFPLASDEEKYLSEFLEEQLERFDRFFKTK